MKADPLKILRDVMFSANDCGAWLTLNEIEKLTGYQWGQILDALATLRKEGFVCERRVRGYETYELEYRLLQKPPDTEAELLNGDE
jgi:predicted transcriptional regulator